MKSWRQIAIEVKVLAAKAVDSAKSFDYQEAADEIKNRAEPLAKAVARAAPGGLERAKGLAREGVDSVRSFDYQGATDEIKSRAAPLATAAATAAESALEQAKTPGVQEMAVGAGKMLMGTIVGRGGGVGRGQVREGGKEFLAGLERVKTQHVRETRKEDGKHRTDAGQE